MNIIHSADKAIRAIRATQIEYGIEDDWNLNGVISFLKKTEEPKTPRFYTPEQWEEETGESLTDSTPVFFRRKVFVSRDNSYKWSDNWHVDFWKNHKGTNGKQIVIAAPAGPPPDDWRPEGEK